MSTKRATPYWVVFVLVKITAKLANFLNEGNYKRVNVPNADQPNFITRSETFDRFSDLKDPAKNVCIIFGAGASRGYTERTMNFELPPIVGELFDESNSTVKRIINLPKHRFIYQHKHYLPEILREEYNNDLEAYLSEFYSRKEDDDLFIELLLYLQDLFSHASREIDEEGNNYQKLLHRLNFLRGGKDWSCLTFNYDTILEKSFIANGADRQRKFVDLSSYLKGKPKILKIHGGINFRHRLEEEANQTPRKTERDLFESMMKESLPKSYVAVVDPNVEIRDFYESERRHLPGRGPLPVSFNKYDFPFMMIPIHGTTGSRSAFFEKMIDDAKREILASDLVVAIGYNFGDDSFCSKISSIDFSKKELILVGKDSLLNNPTNHLGFQNASKAWKNGKVRIFEGNGFTEFVKAIMVKQ